MSILQVTSSRFCLYLLNIYHFTYTFSHAHTEAHTHKHTCAIRAQEEWRQPGTGACLRGAEERLLLETKTLHTQKKGGKKNVRKTPIFTILTNRIRAHRASSKATRLILTKQSKQHQSMMFFVHSIPYKKFHLKYRTRPILIYETSIFCIEQPATKFMKG